MNKLNKLQLLSIGADIEIFLKNKQTGEVVSSEGIIKGSKYDPYQFVKSNKYYSTSLDNVLTEFTIPPATKANQFIKYINRSLNYIRDTIGEGLDLHISAAESLDPKYLMTDQAQHFGCEPDYNAYTMSMNDKPFADDPCLRSSGGHLHMGFDTIEVPFDGFLFNYEPDEQRSEIVKALDLFVSVPLVLMEPDNKRKELYGKAGAYRPKPYGVEYRTPSNFYISTDELKEWAFNSVTKAFDFLNNNGGLSNDVAVFIQNTINNNNKDDAKMLINDFNLQLV